ncbi:hypothetical protein [Thauera sp. SDU_THAU2]|uniref:hypothetical protein n=1 Tax=Thauera sp. SDU_THAU2 TaxID=3136633 RepID=UPI00311EB984
MPTNEDWNWVQLMLMQGLLGAISPNLRRIVLCHEHGQWVIEATLREHCPEDVEEIRDVADETSIFMEDLHGVLTPAAQKGIGCSFVIDAGFLPVVQDEIRRTVFLEKQ